MNADQFRSRLRECREMPGEDDPLYRSRMNELIEEAGGSITLGKDPELDQKLSSATDEDRVSPWSEIGPSPLDRRLAVVCELYLDADPEQRQELRECFAGEDLRRLNVFMGRAARLIGSTEDTEWFRLGLAAAGIEAARYDFRDFIFYLDILRFGAERAEIETGPFFEEAMEMSPLIQDYLRRLRSRSSGSLKASVRLCGPPQWAEEAKAWWRFW